MVLPIVFLTSSACQPWVSPVALENRLAGTAEWQIAPTDAALNREIEGYASATSVVGGSQIEFFVHTEEPTYTLQVYRLGWYQGLGAREMMPAVERTGVAQPVPAPDPDGMIRCAWSDPYGLTVPVTWTSGVYLVKLTADQSGKQRYIPFVVRNDVRRAHYLFALAVTTWQAYNNWGGKSYYPNSTGTPATLVSFDRPYGNYENPGEDPARQRTYGAGLLFFWEYPMLRWLEREGYDVTYATSIDVHRDPALVRNARAYLSVGHDEYWSAEMRANVEAARDTGVNLGFFSGNNVWGLVEIDPSLRQMRNVKLFRDQSRPPTTQYEESLLGVMTVSTQPGETDVVVHDASHWAFKKTGLRNGDRLRGVLGYEVDGVCNANLVPGRAILARTPFPSANLVPVFPEACPDNQAHADMTVYPASSGATVFAAGTIQWSYGLDDYEVDDRQLVSTCTVQQTTANILARLRGRKSGPDVCASRLVPVVGLIQR